MNAWVKAEISSWIECGHCGRVEGPSVPIRIPEEVAFAAVEKVCTRCERCRGHATMHLQRALPRLQ
jgi:hypothetical protein